MNLYIFLFQCCKVTNHAAAVAYKKYISGTHAKGARQAFTPTYVSRKSNIGFPPNPIPKP